MLIPHFSEKTYFFRRHVSFVQPILDHRGRSCSIFFSLPLRPEKSSLSKSFYFPPFFLSKNPLCEHGSSGTAHPIPSIEFSWAPRLFAMHRGPFADFFLRDPPPPDPPSPPPSLFPLALHDTLPASLQTDLLVPCFLPSPAFLVCKGDRRVTLPGGDKKGHSSSCYFPPPPQRNQSSRYLFLFPAVCHPRFFDAKQVT